MLHFRIQYENEIKAFLVEYDSEWSLIASKTSQLFNLPANHVALVHTDSDGKVITLGSQEELRSYILGPHSARAVAGLPLDFDLKDKREWKYSIISHIGASDTEDADFEIPDRETVTVHAQSPRFADEDYTFVQPPALDASDMVHVVVPGEGPYAVPRHMGVGSNVNIHIVDTKQGDDGTWDELKPPSEGNVSVDYPNIYLDEPPKPESVTSSGPPRIPSREKGKGRAISSTPFNPNPYRPPSNIEIASDRSIVNNETPFKPPIHIPITKLTDSPIPLISNIVKKMSLEDAKARTIYDGEDTPAPGSKDVGYSTLVNQLVSLVDVVTQILEDPGVADHVRDAWEGFTHQKSAIPPPSPTSTLGFGRHERKSKEFALAEGLVNVMKKVATIVEDDASDVEERDDDVVWTHKTRGHGLSDIRLPRLDIESKLNTPLVPRQNAASAAPTAPSVRTSKQRLEDAKAAYKAEKARYRAERENRRKEKFAAKGIMFPEPTADAGVKTGEPVPITPAPPGRRTSLMSAAADPSARARSRLAEAVAAAPKAPSSAKPTAGSTYSPALLPARISNAAPSSITKHASLPTQVLKEEIAIDGGDEGSDGPGTPKPPPRPSRDSAQFDFDAFMEANAWGPKVATPWLQDQSPYPTSARPSMVGKSASMLPPPRVYMQTGVELDNPHGPIDTFSDQTAPTPPPRPQIFSPTQSPPMQVRNGMESMLAEAIRANPLPRTLSKRNRWGDGLGGRRLDVGREDSILAEAHPPPVYSTDGEGGDELLESGGAVREKGNLPLNEEFKRRCLAVLHEYNVTQSMYPNLDVLIAQGIQVVGSNRQMVRLAAESNGQAREKFLSEEVPNVVNRVLAAVQRGSTPNYV